MNIQKIFKKGAFLAGLGFLTYLILNVVFHFMGQLNIDLFWICLFWLVVATGLFRRGG